MDTAEHPGAGDTPAVLRGREPEMAVAAARLAEVRAGRGGVLLVGGPPGIGRTRLLTEIRRRAEQAGLRVLHAETIDGRQKVPLAPLLEATLGARPPVGDPAAVRDLGTPADMSRWAVRELRAALVAAAARTPLVIVLDDLQWADEGTLTAIRTLAGSLRHTAVLWVLAARQSPAGPVTGDALSRIGIGGAAVLRLGPLPAPVTTAIIEDFVAATAGPVLVALAATARGHPSLLMELLRGLREEGRLRVARGQAAVVGDALPNRLTRSVNDRLTALSPFARRAVRMAAVLPERFTLAQLAEVLGCRPADLREPVEEAVRADLLAADRPDIRFRHELLRQAARDAVPPALRRALEREAAEVLLGAGSAPVAAGSTGPLDRAVRFEPAAGALSPPAEGRPRTTERQRSRVAYNLMMGGEPGPAQRYAGQLLDETDAVPDHADRLTGLMVLSGAHCAQGDGAEALEAVRELLADPPGPAELFPPLRHLHAANVLHCLGRSGEATAALAEARRRTEQGNDGPVGSMLNRLAAQVDLLEGRLPAARADTESADEVHEDARRASFAGVIQMVTLAGLAAHLGEPALVRAAAAAADRLRTGDGVAARRWAARVLAWLAADRDDPAEAVRLLADDPLVPASPPLPADLELLIVAARAGVAAGDDDLTKRVLAAASMLDGDAAAAPAFAAAAAHVRGLADDDAGQLLAAAAMHAAARRPLLAANADEDAGRALSHAGRVTQAVEQWQRAFDRYAALGATAGTARVGRLLRDRGVVRRPPAEPRPETGWGSLTEAELKVVRLIAAGSTNRNAAKELFLSPHTVNSHVRSAFGKLGINSRVQLANVMRDHDAGHR